MRILILNWKDIRHPQHGGAEIVTHQFSKHLVKFGHEVTLFTVSIPQQPTTEIIDHVKVVRQGNFLSVYLYAFWFYQKNKHRFDIVIDQIHGLPFFTPLYVRKPILAYIHEIAGPIWFAEWPKPMAFLGNTFEKFYFRLYQKIPFVTDSLSTQQELVTYGIPQKNIEILPLTIQKPQTFSVRKSVYPSLVYIGRIYPMKRIELLIQATSYLMTSHPNLRIIIAGVSKKKYGEFLQSEIHRLHLEKHIQLLPPISELEKYKLFARAWIHVQPSLKEGFGLTVLEAASVGTPTVCFNVSGLKDLIKHFKNGIIAKTDTAESLASALRQALSPAVSHTISTGAARWSRTFPNWEEQTKHLEKILYTIFKAFI